MTHLNWGSSGGLTAPTTAGTWVRPPLVTGSTQTTPSLLTQALGTKRGKGPLANGLQREPADQIDLRVQWMTLVTGRDAGHDRHLVLGTATSFAAGAHTAQACVVELASAAQLGRVVPLYRGPVCLLAQQQSGRAAHALLAPGRQGRQPGLALAEQVDGQEPSRQRQLGVFQWAPCGRRGLVPTVLAMEDLACVVPHGRVFAAAAPRVPEAIRPPRTPVCLGALRLGAEAGPESGARHDLLAPDLAVGHGLRSVVREPPVMESMVHGTGLAEAHFQSGHRLTTRAGIVMKARTALMNTHPARRYMPPSVLCVRSFMKPTA